MGQANWQKFFYKKASSRSKCGFMSGKPKDSIFKAPDRDGVLRSTTVASNKKARPNRKKPGAGRP